MFDLQGKVIIVTGGLSGIGLETVKFLLDKYIKGITIIDVNQKLADKVLLELTQNYGSNKILFCRCDVSNKNEFEEAFKKTIEKFENVDILINNAGIADDSNWEKIIPVNLNGVINGTLLAIDQYIPQYKSSEEGLVINVSSVAGLTSLETFPVYSSTKSAVIQFSRALGTDFHFNRTTVRVVAVCPGPTDTALFVDLHKRCLKEEYGIFFIKENADKFIPQKAEDAAKAVGKIITDAKNGSVWVAEGGEVYEIELPNYKQLKIE